MSHNVRNWAHAFMRGLRDLGYSFTIRADAMDAVDLGRVRQLLHVRAAQQWQGLHVCPGTCPSPRAQLCTYHRWFARPSFPHLVPCHIMLLACNVQLGICGGFCALGLGAMVCQLTLGVGLACPGCNVICAKCHGSSGV